MTRTRTAMVGGVVALGLAASGACGPSVETNGASGVGGSSSSAGGSGPGGSAGSGGTSGTGGGACGDPAVAARLTTCRMAQDEPSCESAGGTWTPVGPVPDPLCECPTGEDGCPCTRSSDCLAGCFAMTTDGTFGCDGVTEGTCAPFSITVGCWCVFDESGKPDGLCID